MPPARVAARKHRRPNERERSASPTARSCGDGGRHASLPTREHWPQRPQPPLVTRGRQDAAFVIVGSVGNSSSEGARRLGRRRRGSGRAGSSLLASWASLNGVPDTTDTTDTRRQLSRPKPALSHRNRHHHPSPVPGAMAFHRNADVGQYRVIDGVDVAVVHCSPSAITECCCGSCRSGGFRAC